MRLRRLAEPVVRGAVQVTGRAGVERLLRHLAVTVVAADLEFVHTVRVLREQRLELMPEYPEERLQNVLVHRRGDRTDHPAVAVAGADLLPYRLRLRAVPEFVPLLPIEIAHDFFVFRAVARHDIAVRVDEEGVETHVAREQTLLPVNIVDESVVEVGAEPLLRTVTAEELVDEVLKILCHHRAVVNDVLRLDEVEAVVQARGRELHTHLIREVVERHEVGCVLVLHRHAETDVLHAHGAERFQRLVPALETVFKPADLVIDFFKPLDGNADPDVREFLRQIHDSVREKAVRRNDDPIALFIQFPHNVFQVGADKRLAARNVREVHGREFADCLEREFLLGLRGGFIPVAHRATCVTAVGDDDRTVQLFCCCHIVSVRFAVSAGFAEIDRHEFFGVGGDRVESGAETVAAHFGGACRVVPQGADGGSERRGVAALEENARRLVACFDEFGNAPDMRPDDGRAVHLRFHDREGAVLVPLRGVHRHACLADERSQGVTRLESDERHVRDALDALLERTAPGDYERNIREFPRGFHQRADPLLLREPPEVQDIVLFLRRRLRHCGVNEVMERHRPPDEVRVGVEFLFHKAGATDDRVDFAIGLFPAPVARLLGADERFCPRPVNALALGAVEIMPADALLAHLARRRIHQHMVGADELIVVRRVDDPHGVPRLLLPAPCLNDNGRRELIVEVVEVDDIRPEIVEDEPQFPSRLARVNGFQRVEQFREF